MLLTVHVIVTSISTVILPFFSGHIEPTILCQSLSVTIYFVVNITGICSVFLPLGNPYDHDYFESTKS